MPVRRTHGRTSRLLRSNARPISLDDLQLYELFNRFYFRLRERAQNASSSVVKEGEVLYAQDIEVVDVAGAAKKVRVLFIATDPARGIILPGKRVDSKATRASGKYRALTSYDEIAKRRRRIDGLPNQAPALDEGDVDAIIGVGFPIVPGPDGRLRIDPSHYSHSLERAKETLRHEMTHARDIYRSRKDRKRDSRHSKSSQRGRGKKRGFRSSKTTAALTESGATDALQDVAAGLPKHDAKYFNQLHEIRAHAQNILIPLRREVERIMYDMKLRGVVVSGGDYASIIMAALSTIPKWRKMEKHLTTKGLNLTLRILVTALEDEGIIRIE